MYPCRPLSLVQIIVQVIDRTRSTPAAYRVVECYYLGTREAQAQHVCEREGGMEESGESEGEVLRGRRQGVSESALPRPPPHPMGNVVLDAEYAATWEILWEIIRFSYKL